MIRGIGGDSPYPSFLPCIVIHDTYPVQAEAHVTIALCFYITSRTPKQCLLIHIHIHTHVHVHVHIQHGTHPLRSRQESATSWPVTPRLAGHGRNTARHLTTVSGPALVPLPRRIHPRSRDPARGIKGLALALGFVHHMLHQLAPSQARADAGRTRNQCLVPRRPLARFRQQPSRLSCCQQSKLDAETVAWRCDGLGYQAVLAHREPQHQEGEG